MNHDQCIIYLFPKEPWRFGLITRLFLINLLPGTCIHSRDISSEHERSSWFCEPGVLPQNNLIFLLEK